MTYTISKPLNWANFSRFNFCSSLKTDRVKNIFQHSGKKWVFRSRDLDLEVKVTQIYRLMWHSKVHYLTKFGPDSCRISTTFLLAHTQTDRRTNQYT